MRSAGCSCQSQPAPYCATDNLPWESLLKAHIEHCTLHTKHCTLFTALYTAHRTLHTTHCTCNRADTAHCTKTLDTVFDDLLSDYNTNEPLGGKDNLSKLDAHQCGNMCTLWQQIISSSKHFATVTSCATGPLLLCVFLLRPAVYVYFLYIQLSRCNFSTPNLLCVLLLRPAV